MFSKSQEKYPFTSAGTARSKRPGFWIDVFFFSERGDWWWVSQMDIMFLPDSSSGDLVNGPTFVTISGACW